MNGKIAGETTKKLILNNIPLALVYLVLQTVTNFVGNDYIKVSTYVLGALHLMSIVLYALCIAVVVLSLFKTIVMDLFSEKSYKYYSLPYKKSEIILSKAVPAIIIEGLMVTMLFEYEVLYEMICILFGKSSYLGQPVEVLNEMVFNYITRFVLCLMIVFTVGFLVLLAFVISRCFDPSKIIRNMLLAVIIEVIVNLILYFVIENISAVYSEKYTEAVQKAVQVSPILTDKELYASAGLIAYYNEIFSAVFILIIVIEIVCCIIASRKLADKKLNVV